MGSIPKAPTGLPPWESSVCQHCCCRLSHWGQHYLTLISIKRRFTLPWSGRPGWDISRVPPQEGFSNCDQIDRKGINGEPRTECWHSLLSGSAEDVQGRASSERPNYYLPPFSARAPQAIPGGALPVVKVWGFWPIAALFCTPIRRTALIFHSIGIIHVPIRIVLIFDLICMGTQNENWFVPIKK